MKEKVLEIASKYFNYNLTSFNKYNIYYDEYVSTEIPGWVFIRLYDDKCYIINALYYNESQNRIFTATSDVTNYMLFYNTQLDEIEKYLMELNTEVKKLKIKMELDKITKDF